MHLCQMQLSISDRPRAQDASLPACASTCTTSAPYSPRMALTEACCRPPSCLPDPHPKLRPALNPLQAESTWQKSKPFKLPIPRPQPHVVLASACKINYRCRQTPGNFGALAILLYSCFEVVFLKFASAASLLVPSEPKPACQGCQGSGCRSCPNLRRVRLIVEQAL